MGPDAVRLSGSIRPPPHGCAQSLRACNILYAKAMTGNQIATFTSMEQSTAEDWAIIAAEFMRYAQDFPSESSPT